MISHFMWRILNFAAFGKKNAKSCNPYLVSDWQPTSTMGVEGDTARTSGHQ